jgi:hypothetical protein
MPVHEMITISKEEYDELVKDSDFLHALEQAGVDNWEGYSDAVDIYREA